MPGLRVAGGGALMLAPCVLRRTKKYSGRVECLVRVALTAAVAVLEGKRWRTRSRRTSWKSPHCRSRTRNVSTVEEGREVVFDLAAARSSFLAPCTWICPVPRTPYRRWWFAAGFHAADDLCLTRHGQDGTIAGGISRSGGPETLGARANTSCNSCAGSRRPDSATDHSRWWPRFSWRNWPNSWRGCRSMNGGHTVLWQSVCDYLSEHWSEPQLSRKGAAAFFNRHPNHFSRFFHAHAKCNFRTYVNEIRLERSIHFLRDLRYNVTDVACLCGFSDLQYFIRCFRERFGLTPGEYRKRSED